MTEEQARSKILKALDHIRQMIAAGATFRMSPDNKTASTMLQTFPRHDDGGHMAIMLVVSEQVAPVSAAKAGFAAWADEH